MLYESSAAHIIHSKCSEQRLPNGERDTTNTLETSWPKRAMKLGPSVFWYRLHRRFVLIALEGSPNSPTSKNAFEHMNLA